MKALTFEEAAEAAGWKLDTSPTTELSAEIWWRHQMTFALKREETLRDEIDYSEP